MTLAELRTNLRIYLNDRNSERWTDADLLVLLNRGQEQVQQIIDDADEKFFSACQNYNVLASTDSYEFTLPADCKKIVLAERLEGTSRPQPVQWTNFSDRHNLQNVDYLFAQTTPYVHCYLRGAKLGVVAPSTSFTLRIWYIKRLPNFAGDTDTTEIPAEFQNLIALTAAKLAQPSEQIPFAHDDEFVQEVNRLASYIECRQRQTPRYVNYIFP
jgi:hypothetical protein